MTTKKKPALAGGFSICASLARFDYANDALTFENTFVTADATWFTPLIAARAIRQTSRAYSTKS